MGDTMRAERGGVEESHVENRWSPAPVASPARSRVGAEAGVATDDCLGAQELQ